MAGTPAKRTLRKWVTIPALPKTCSHSEKSILHHDHLINHARELLRKRHTTTSRCFQKFWIDFLNQNQSLFLTPTWVCKTCNEQDAALKGAKESKGAKKPSARIIPKGMTLCAQELELLANVKKASLETVGKKKTSERVRNSFLPRKDRLIAEYIARRRKVASAVMMHK